MNLRQALSRYVVAIGLTGLVVSGISVATLVSRPSAATGSEPQSVQLVEPAADLPDATTTTTADTAERAERAAVRSEVGATRAEVAAGRAEVAQVWVEEIAATTTTTAAPTTATSGPTQLVENPNVHYIPTTTTTTAPPKTWVEIGRFPAAGSDRRTAGPPAEIHVTLQTGVLRVKNLRHVASGPIIKGGPAAVWLGLADAPTQACPPAAGDTGTVIAFAPADTNCPAWGSWPTGEQSISGGQYWDDPAAGGWRTFYETNDVIIEEYR